jgi:hypothetical protein
MVANEAVWAKDDVRYDFRDYGKVISDVLGGLQNGGYAHLDALYAEYFAGGARTRDGTWMIRAFPTAFESIFPYLPEARVEEIFRDWKARDPGSELRPVAEAFAWQERAWFSKGIGCYTQGLSSGRKAFDALLDRSAKALREDEERGQGSALWHVAAMMVAGGQLRPAVELDALLADSVKRFPGFEPLYAARMTFLLPDWGGSFEAVDRFARESTVKTRAIEGNALYTWLYLDLASRPGCARLFQDSNVSWPEMKAGFDDILARYPDTRARNTYATFACRMRDVVTTERLLAELGKDAQLGIWSSGISSESCREMVRAAHAARAMIGRPNMSALGR